MGAYAAILERTIPFAVSPLPLLPRERNIVFVSPYFVGLAALAETFPDCDRVAVILDDFEAANDARQFAVPSADSSADPESARTTTTSAPRIRYFTWNTARRRHAAGLAPDARAALRQHRFDAAIFMLSLAHSSGRMIFALRALGIRTVIFNDDGSWHRLSTDRALVAKLLQRGPARQLSARLAGRLSSAHQHSAAPHEAFRDFVHRRCESLQSGTPLDTAGQSPGAHSRRLSIWHYIGGLDSGGAERQLVNLASSLHRRGHDCSVFTTFPLHGPLAHYRPLLESHSIRTIVAGDRPRLHLSEFSRWLARPSVDLDVLNRVPGAIRPQIFDLLGELVLNRPDVLNCWLDHPNIVGGIAGVLADVPAVFLSTRNLNPTYFPDFYQHWMLDWYRALAVCNRVHFLANSRAGAADYSRWLDIPIDRFTVILNGIDPDSINIPSPADIDSLRRELNLITPDGRPRPVVTGVFRLAPEKRPRVFVETIRRLARNVPDLAALIVGIGPLEDQTRRAVREAGLENAIRFLGQRRDVPTILAASDLLLLTSFQEGTPNCVLEAMYLSRPVVATANSGTNDVIRDQITGLLRPVDDPAALADAALRILRDPALAARLGAAGRAEVESRFLMSRVTSETESLYRHALAEQKSSTSIGG